MQVRAVNGEAAEGATPGTCSVWVHRVYVYTYIYIHMHMHMHMHACLAGGLSLGPVALAVCVCSLLFSVLFFVQRVRLIRTSGFRVLGLEGCGPFSSFRV